MSSESSASTQRLAHRGALVGIALLAGLSALQPRAAEEPAPDPQVTALAVALAVGVMVLRRAASSPVISDSTRLTLALCTWACAVTLAGVGSYVAMDLGQARTGLAFALAAGILSIRPISPLPPPKRPAS